MNRLDPCVGHEADTFLYCFTDHLQVTKTLICFPVLRTQDLWHITQMQKSLNQEGGF